MKVFPTFLGLKWIAGVLLLTHLVSRWIFPENNLLIDLIFFNLIGLFSAMFDSFLISDFGMRISDFGMQNAE